MTGRSPEDEAPEAGAADRASGAPEVEETDEAPRGGPDLTGRRGMPAGTAVVVALFLALGVAAVLLPLLRGGAAGESGGYPAGLGPEDVDPSVPDWRPDAKERRALEELAEERREAAPPEDDDAVSGLRETHRRFHRIEHRTKGDTRSRALQEAHAHYEQRALSVLQRRGPEAYMGVGQKLLDRFEEALRGGDRETLHELGGTYTSHLRSTRLVDGELAPRPGAVWVVRTAFLARWAMLVRRNRPRSALLEPVEQRLLLRWKVAANPLIDAARRRELADSLRELDPSYPVTGALAARAADDGRWTEAARLYRRAAREHPDDARLRANAVWASRKAREPSSAAPSPSGRVR